MPAYKWIWKMRNGPHSVEFAGQRSKVYKQTMIVDGVLWTKPGLKFGSESVPQRSVWPPIQSEISKHFTASHWPIDPGTFGIRRNPKIQILGETDFPDHGDDQRVYLCVMHQVPLNMSSGFWTGVKREGVSCVSNLDNDNQDTDNQSCEEQKGFKNDFDNPIGLS